MVFVDNFVTVKSFNIKKFVLLLTINFMYLQWAFIKSLANRFSLFFSFTYKTRMFFICPKMFQFSLPLNFTNVCEVQYIAIFQGNRLSSRNSYFCVGCPLFCRFFADICDATCSVRWGRRIKLVSRWGCALPSGFLQNL